MQKIVRIEAAFTRPADTTAYAVGDLVANSTTAGSVVPMSFVMSDSYRPGMIRRLRLRKTGAATTAASFRLHLYTASPTPANGDNSAWSTNQAATYLGNMDVTCGQAFTDGAGGNGVPNVGTEMLFSAATLYGLLEARDTYTPASAEVFTLKLETIMP